MFSYKGDRDKQIFPYKRDRDKKGSAHEMKGSKYITQCMILK